MSRQPIYVPLDEHFFANPKVMAAGWDGAMVFMGLLVLHKRYGPGGRLQSRHATAGGLRCGMPAVAGGKVDEELLAAVQQCCAAELLEIDPETGEVVIPGWAADYATKCAKCPERCMDPRATTCESCKQKRRKDSGQDDAPAPRPKKTGRGKSCPDVSGHVQTSSGTLLQKGSEGKGSTPPTPPEGVGGAPHPEEPDPTAAEVERLVGVCGKLRIRTTPAWRLGGALNGFVRDGGTEAELRGLVKLAKRKASKDPVGLLMAWLKDSGTWRDALLDLEGDAKHAAARKRKPPKDPNADPQRPQLELPTERSPPAAGTGS